MARIFQDGAEMGRPTGTPALGTYGHGLWKTHQRLGSANRRGTFEARTTTVNSGGYAYWCGTESTSGSGNIIMQRDLGENLSELYCRCEYRAQSRPEVIHFMGLMDANEAVSVIVGVDDGADIVINKAGTEIGRLSGLLVVDVYMRYELRVIVDDTAGLVELKVNGNSLFTWNGDTQDGRLGTVRHMIIGCWRGDKEAIAATGLNNWIDDIAVNDTTGTVNNSWPGKGSILLLKPKGVGNYSQFTPSNNTYDNWELVDEVPHDSDSTYVYSETADHIDTYEMEELVADKGIDPTELVVKAVQVCLTGRYEGVDAHLAPMLRSGTTDHEGDKMYMAASYYRLFDEVFSINPFTSAAWAYAEVDGLEAGVKHKAHVE